jgi:hypothetical protein
VDEKTKKSEKNKDKPSNFYKNENKKGVICDTSDNDNSFMGTVRNNKGNILILKSPFTSDIFYHTFDECLLCSSPFETRRNSEALRLFEKFFEYCPNQFRNQALYNQSFRDPSYFDIVLYSNYENFNEDQFSTLKKYFSKMGLFGRDFGFNTFMDLNSLFINDPNFETIKNDDSHPSENSEKIISSTFYQLLEFLIWIRNSPKDDDKKPENKLKKLSVNNDLFKDLKLKTPKTMKKRGFDINDFKGSPFFYFYKVNF